MFRDECLGISLRLGTDLEDYQEGDLKKNGLLDWRLALVLGVAVSHGGVFLYLSDMDHQESSWRGYHSKSERTGGKLFSIILERDDLRVLSSSAAYSIPLSSVQTSPWLNAHCQLNGYDPETLLGRFEKGEYLENIPVEHRGCHWIPTENDVRL